MATQATTTTPIKRVQIWNAFFALAREQARALHEGRAVTELEGFDPGGMLPEEKVRAMGTLVLCALAIEARVNHLLEELEETKAIAPGCARAARRLPTKEKWFLLPGLAGRQDKTPQADVQPHQAVAQICDLRNDLLHVDFQGLINRVPTAKTALSYYRNFVGAMEDMNVILGRIPEARQEVLRLGRFE